MKSREELNRELAELLGSLRPRRARSFDKKCKDEAMQLVRDGADPTVQAHGETGNTLLHVLVVESDSGSNGDEIAELSAAHPEAVNALNKKNQTPLKSLLIKDHRTFGPYTKYIAMLLAKAGADVSVSTIDQNRTDGSNLLHYLVKNSCGAFGSGHNDAAIAELLSKQKDLADVQDQQDNTPLQTLLNQFSIDKDVVALKSTAMLLAKYASDLTVCDHIKNSGKTLLHYLVLTNKDGVNEKEIIELLEKNKELVDLPNQFGYSPLKCVLNHLMSHEKDVSAFKSTIVLLAKNGADLTVTDLSGMSGRTALHCLALTNENGVHDAEMTALLEHNKNLANVKDLYAARTPLQAVLDRIAMNSGNLPSLISSAMILAKYAGDLRFHQSTRDEGYTLLHVLVLNNKNGIYTKDIKELLDRDPTLVHAVSGRDGHTALQSLLHECHSMRCELADFKATAMLLVEYNADIHVSEDAKFGGHTLFHRLVLDNLKGACDAEILHLLKLDPSLVNSLNLAYQTPLKALLNAWDIQKSNFDDRKSSAMLLLRNGADVTEAANNGNTIMHALVARYRFSKEKIKAEILELQAKNPDLMNVKKQMGLTPLHYLIASRDDVTADEVDELVALGCDLKTTDQYGRTLLHTTCLVGCANFNLSKHLAAKGLDVTDVTNNSDTMLHCSAGLYDHKNSSQWWDWMLENGVMLNAQNKNGDTALHCAIKGKNLAMVSWLLKNNADLNRINNQNELPVKLAEQSNSIIFDLVLDYMKQIVEHGQLKKPVAQPVEQPAEVMTPVPVVEGKKIPVSLVAAINDMRTYGETLVNQGAAKGDVAIQLANQLQEKAENYFVQDADPKNFATFKADFTELLNSKNETMSEYRGAWKTIVLNVVLSLLGIGLILNAVSLIYNKFAHNRALFFMQKTTTTCEDKVTAVDAEVNKIAMR